MPLGEGRLRFSATRLGRELIPKLPAELGLRGSGAEQRYRVILGDHFFSRVTGGCARADPEIEVGRFLTDVSPFPSIAPVLGTLLFEALTVLPWRSRWCKPIAPTKEMPRYIPSVSEPLLGRCADQPASRGPARRAARGLPHADPDPGLTYCRVASSTRPAQRRSGFRSRAHHRGRSQALDAAGAR